MPIFLTQQMYVLVEDGQIVGVGNEIDSSLGPQIQVGHDHVTDDGPLDRIWIELGLDGAPSSVLRFGRAKINEDHDVVELFVLTRDDQVLGMSMSEDWIWDERDAQIEMCEGEEPEPDRDDFEVHEVSLQIHP